MQSRYQHDSKGFSLLELIITITIIGLIVAILLSFIGTAREKGRDSNRSIQSQEILKALELYYTENGVYPSDEVADVGNATAFTNASPMATDLAAAGYLSRVPRDPVYPPAAGYLYCASNDRRSMAILVNTERDKGGTDYCVISAGPQAYSSSMCTVPQPVGGVMTLLSGIDRCSNRF